MPLYEYRCAACGHELEALQKITDAPLKACPECKKRRLERLMSAPAFRLKGGGWYETDFKSDGEKKRNLVEAAERKESAAADGGKSDSAAGEGAKFDGGKNDGAKKDGAKADGTAKAASPKNGAKDGKPAAKTPSVKPAPKPSSSRRPES
jgi:putative FmdB family regulatory protein